MPSKYSIEVRTLVEDPNFDVFGFEYGFYTTDVAIKENFEQKFIDHFYYHEIGSETVARWKHMLRSRLNVKAPYYKQLYETELKSKNIEFLLNKDYTETYTRETEQVTTETGGSSDSSSANSTQSIKASNLDNGVASVGLSDNLLTGVSQDTSNGTSTSQKTHDRDGSERGNENYTLTGKGNIGTTSSAKLLQEWRDVLINIDELLLEDLDDLFMKIY